MKTLENISNEIAEKQKELKTTQDTQYIVEDEILRIQKDIIKLHGDKKDKEIVATKGRHNIRQLILDIKILTNLFWNMKNN